MMMDGGGMMGAVFVLWILFVLVLIALAVAALAWLVRSLRQKPTTQGRASAREEVDRRYAAGEISREEYLAVRHDLES